MTSQKAEPRNIETVPRKESGVKLHTSLYTKQTTQMSPYLLMSHLVTS